MIKSKAYYSAITASDTSWLKAPRQTFRTGKIIFRRLRRCSERFKNKDRFEKQATWPIGHDPVWQNVNIEIYRYRGRFGPLKKSITLPMPSVGRDIEIRLPNR
jgi:hypothetical protein